jgi:hypothetical protein
MTQKVRTPLLRSSKPFLAVFAVVVVMLSTFLAGMHSPRTALAATSNGINFQARLMSNTGGIVPDGFYNVEFKIYNAATSGTLQFTDTYYDANGVTAGQDARVRVANGYLTVSIGSQSGNPFPSTINWDQQMWITMNIGGTTQTATPTWDGEMSPRLQLTAVPYAFRAGQLASLAGSFTGVLKFANSFGQDSTITLPDPGASTATVCYQGSASCGFLTGTAAGFIQNGTTVQTGANFNIRSAATGSVGAVVQGANGQTADLLQLQSWNGTTATNVFSVNNSGVVTLAGGLTADVTTPATATATAITVKPGTSSGASSNGAALNLRGGDGSGTTTVTGGAVAIQGGSATGGSGTRTGGDVTIDAGTGAAFTNNGTVTVGGTNAKTLTIGATASIGANTQTINIGTLNTTGTQNVTIGSGSSATAGTTVVQAKGAVNITGGAASTWDIGNNQLSLQTTTNGAITTGTGLLTQGGNITFSGTAARTITGPATGGLTVNVTGGPLTLSTTTSGALAVTSAGALNFTGAANSTWSVGAGNTLAITSSNLNVTALGVLTTTSAVLTGANALTLGTTGTNTGAILFKGATAASGVVTLIGPANPTTNTITLPNETGTVCTTAVVCTGYAASSVSGNYLAQVPTTTATNTVTPTVASVVGLTVNATSGTAATAAIFNQNQGADVLAVNATGGSQTNGVVITRTNAGTLSNGLSIVNTSGTITNGISFTGTIGTDINRASGILSLQGTGGVTVTAGGTTTLGLDTAGAGTVNLGNANATTIGIGGAASAVTTIGGGNVAHTIAIGAAGTSTIQGITLGSQGSTSSTTIQGGTGSGAVSVQAAATGTITVGTANANTINIGSTSATTVTTVQGGGGVNIGNGGTTGAVQIGNTTGAVSQTISIGTNATASATNTVNIGSGAVSSGTVTINAGVGSGNNITLQSNNATGGTVVKSGTNSTTAFQLQNGSGSNGIMMNFDSANGWIVTNATTHPNNILENPSFESNAAFQASGWNYSGASAITVGSSDAHHGNNEMITTGDGVAQKNVNSLKYVEVVPGDQYYLELWYKTAVGVTGGGTGASFSISYYDANKGFLSNSSATNLNAANNSYTRATNTGTVPAGAYYVRMTIAVNSTSTGNWFFDDLYMARINESAPQLFKNTVNSATAFQIQDSSANSYMNVDTTGAAITVGYASSTTTLNGTVKVATLGAATSNAQSVCRDSSTNALISCDANTTGKPFLQGGNTFGATAVLGTNDANNLQIETNGVVRATFDQSTGLYLGNGVTAAAPNNATVAATGSTTAGTAGGNLTLKGGAGASATTGSVGGSVTIQGGAAAGSGNNNGGDILIQGGAPANSGTGGAVTVRNLADHTSAFRIQNANASSTIFNADTVNGRVGIGGVASFSKFEVLGGDAAIYNSGNNPRLILGDSTSAGQNGYLQWDSTNDYFRIESVGTNGVKINDNFVAIGNIFPNQPLIVGNGSTNLFQINTVGVVSLIGGQTADITTASAATATGLVLQPGASTGASVNGPSTAIRGGDATGTTSVTGGALTLQAGNATGGSGTRNGGSVTIDAGTGATANGAITIGGTNATGVTIGKAAGTTTLNGSVKVSTLGAATANSASECRDTVTTILTSCDSTNTTGRPFLQGGNSFGATGVLGTNDANSLSIRTNGVTRATFDQSNGLYLGLGVTNAAPTAFTLGATSSSAAGAAGAALTIQGGTGASATTGSAGGALSLSGGNAGGSGNNAGGNVTLGGGSATGTGTKGSVIVKNAADSANAFAVQNAAGTTTVLGVDTTNSYVGVGTAAATPGRTLHVGVSNSTVTSQTMLVEQSGTGDSGIEVKNVASSYYIGIDTSDSNRFKISSSAASGTAITFGNNAINLGTASTDAGDQNFQNATKAVSGAAGTMTSISVYINGGSGANQYSVALYADAGGSPSRPGTLIGSSASTSIIPNSWNTVSVSGSITSSTTYWVAFNTNDASANMKFETGAANTSCYVSRTFASGWTTPFGGSCTLGTQNFGIYATYISAVAGDNLSTSLLSIGTTGDTILRNSTNSTAAFQIQKADGTSLLTADTTNTTLLLGAAAGTTTLQGTVKVSTVGATTANAAALCRDTSTTNLISCDANTTGKPFLQGGNTFGATASLGTNDANNLTIKTANVVRATFDQSNNLYLGLGATNAAPTAFNVAATGSTTAGTAGAALTVQGGAGATTTTGSAGGNLTLAGGSSVGGSGNNAGGIVTLQGGAATNTGTAGYVLVKNAQNSATAFIVQDATSNALFTAATGQRMVMVGTTQAGTSTTTPAFMYLSDIPNNAAGNAQITGQWASTANWGLGPNSNANDATLRFGITTGNPTATAGNTWNTSGANLNLLVAGTLRITPNGTNDSLTAFQVQRASGNGAATVFDVDTTNSRVGIGTAAPSTDLSFGGATNRILGVETQGTLNTAGVNLTVRGATGNGTGAGGQVTVQGGTGGATGGGGAVFVQGGNAGGGNTNGGDLTVTGGTGAGSGIKGVVNIGPMVFAAATTQTFSNGGTITQANVDSFATVVVGETTTAGATVTLPDPLNTTAGRTIYVTSTNTSLDFSLAANGGTLTIAMRKNATATMIWNGADWTPGGADSSTTLQAAYNNTLISAGGAEIVLNNNSNTGGLTIRDNVASPISGSLLEVQTAIGTNILSVNNFSTELMTNGGAEDGTTFSTNWTLAGTATTPSRTTTTGQFATGQAGVSSTFGTATNNGVRGNLGSNPATGTTYLVSFTAKLASGSAFTDMRVDYTPTGAATGTQCTANQTIVTTTWTKITCEVLTPGTPVTNPDIIIYQPTTAGVSRVVYIDNLSMTLAAGSGGLPANVQIGGGINGGQVSLFTLDRSASAPVAGSNSTYLGSLYYDTTIGRIQCYESDGWGSCGSAPDNIIILTPEFAGATLNGSGIGAMTSDFCAQQAAVLNVNTGLCPSGEARNFYQWTSPQTTGLQIYSIYVSYKLPSTFKNFSDDNTINLTARTDNTTNAVVTYEVFKSTGSAITACGTETTVTSTINTWQTVPINGNENTTCAFGGSNTVIFKINVKAQSNANAYVGNLTFTYTNN